MRARIARVMFRHLFVWAQRMEPYLEREPDGEWERGYLSARRDVCSMLGMPERMWP